MALFAEILLQDGDQQVYVNGVLDADMSDYTPHYPKAGFAGLALLNVNGWTIKVEGAEICSRKQFGNLNFLNHVPSFEMLFEIIKIPPQRCPALMQGMFIL